MIARAFVAFPFAAYYSGRVDSIEALQIGDCLVELIVASFEVVVEEMVAIPFDAYSDARTQLILVSVALGFGANLVGWLAAASLVGLGEFVGFVAFFHHRTHVFLGLMVKIDAYLDVLHVFEQLVASPLFDAQVHSNPMISVGIV